MVSKYIYFSFLVTDMFRIFIYNIPDLYKIYYKIFILYIYFLNIHKSKVHDLTIRKTFSHMDSYKYKNTFSNTHTIFKAICTISHFLVYKTIAYLQINNYIRSYFIIRLQNFSFHTLYDIRVLFSIKF